MYSLAVNFQGDNSNDYLKGGLIMSKIKALSGFSYTLPILTGYLFLGMAGVLMHEQGYPLWATALISFLTYAGPCNLLP